MKNKKITLIVRRIILAIISIAIGFGIYTWNAERLTGNKMPMPFGFGMGMVLTGSMEPEIGVNDLIFVVKCNEYRPGDDVVFQDKNMLVVHRIRSLEGETAVTYGIANTGDDEPMHISSIKGKVIFTVPNMGNVVTVIKSPIGFIMIISVAALLLFLSYRKENKENKEKNDDLDEIKRQIEELKAEMNMEGETENSAESNDSDTSQKNTLEE